MNQITQENKGGWNWKEHIASWERFLLTSVSLSRGGYKKKNCVHDVLSFYNFLT